MTPTPTPTDIGPICGEGLGPFAQFLCTLSRGTDPQSATNNAIAAVSSFAFFISNIIAILVVVAGVIFIFQFLIGGYSWLTSAGDKAKLETAQQKLFNAVIGLVIVLSSYALISLVGNILGFDILLNNPAEFVRRISNR